MHHSSVCPSWGRPPTEPLRATVVQGCGPLGSKISKDQNPAIGVLWPNKPLHMKKTSLPTHQTQTPSREGLAYHEILADGLVHTARVFGFANDECLVERVANLAWVNGARLVQSNFWQAADIARSLSESLEFGQTQSEGLCRAVGETIITSTEDPFTAIKNYYATVSQCRSWDVSSPESVERIRQTIGEAVLGGLLSRRVNPLAFQALLAHSEKTRNEQSTLANRLIYWAVNKGLPRHHPFIEFCVNRYDSAPERDLLCNAIGRQLSGILELAEPWDLVHWLKPGWVDGLTVGRFAPDAAQEVIASFPAGQWEFTQKLFPGSIVKTSVEGKLNLPEAFMDYVIRFNPDDLADDSVKLENARLLAWSAYDFSFWMGIVAELCPQARGAK